MKKPGDADSPAAITAPNGDSPPPIGERPDLDATQAPGGTPPPPPAPGAGNAADNDPSGSGGPPPETTPAAADATSRVFLRHTTPYPHYRRAGLLLTGQFKPYTVTAEQRAALEQDSWVEFQKPTRPDKA